MVNLLTTPGALTDRQPEQGRMDWLRQHGVQWVSVQVQNGVSAKGRDLAPAKAAGLSAGVWGVSYGLNDAPNADAFFRDGKLLGFQAVLRGADHVIADIEPAAKGTRDSRGLQPYIDGIRAGGWSGPVHLTPLGAPVNAKPHGPNDFAVDVASFLATGGGVLPQAYYNAYDEYRPDLCVDYWRACGVPMDRINVMISVFGGEGKGIRISGDQWVPLLVEADTYRNLSVYMDEALQPFDMEGLHPLTLGPERPPTEEPPPVSVDPARVNRDIAALADTWLEQFADEKPLTRLRCIERIARSTDAGWVAVRQDVVDALNADTQSLRSALQSEQQRRAMAEAALAECSARLATANAKIAAAKRELG